MSLSAFAVFLGGCVTAPKNFSTFAIKHAQLSECADVYSLAQTIADEAKTNEAGTQRVAGFPHLRADRFLASFAIDEKNAQQTAEWVERMRALDLEVRGRELLNSGMSRLTWQQLITRMDACGSQRIAENLNSADDLVQIHKQAQVPDNYSLLKRTLGAYPLAVPFLRLGIKQYHEDAYQAFEKSVAQLNAELPQGVRLRRYVPEHIKPRNKILLSAESALGVPVISSEQWQAIAHQYAPQFEVETATCDDELIDPKKFGPVNPPLASAQQAVVYWYASYTRYNEKILPQLVYTAWFPARTAQGVIDWYAGNYDGISWRVTFDIETGALAPIVYDTIHPCGCYHHVLFPQDNPKNFGPVNSDSFWSEKPLFPDIQVPDQNYVVRLQQKTHYLQQVIDSEEAHSVARMRYQLKPYEALLLNEDGESRLFAQGGLLPESDRAERLWLWPTGIKSPGAMRQRGVQAIRFVGRGHFDDAYLLQDMVQQNDD